MINCHVCQVPTSALKKNITPSTNLNVKLQWKDVSCTYLFDIGRLQVKLPKLPCIVHAASPKPLPRCFRLSEDCSRQNSTPINNR